MSRLFRRFLIVAGSMAALLVATAAAGTPPPRQHAIAMHGEPNLAPDFQHYPFANPNAPKGGTLTLATTGSFDSTNPLIIRGKAAEGIRQFTIESLMSRSLDEPFTLYGLLAESIEVPTDRSSITFHLNPKAAFSDGHPVTAEDVIFSHQLLRDKGRPNHRTYYAKVTTIEKLSDRSVRMTFDDSGDREMPLIMGLMPVLPAHVIDPEAFDKTTLAPPVGSGPYQITKVDPGRSITYTANPEYWGRDLPVNRGRYNFKKIRFDYFRDANVEFEAFKTGNIDLRKEDDPATWAEGYEFPAAKSGEIQKATIPTGLPDGMAALVFNTRRDVFKDQRVRKALIQLFDFEWINKTLFHSLYQRTQSYFERSALASTGHAADNREQALLSKFEDAVRPEILAGTYRFPKSDGTGHNRANAKAAFQQLKAAGYRLVDGKMVSEETGQQLSFEILAPSPALERLLAPFVTQLSRLGIAANVRRVDSSQYQSRIREYDFDMIKMHWRSSLSPGNEQLFRWSSKVADTPGSFNYAGVKNPAADAMIEAMLAAKTEQEFVSAVRALDRVLLSGDYVIPLFYKSKDWVAHWKQLRYPETPALFGFNIDTWWHSTAE
jgi:peptide/nickel transport system substrate-binding protein